MKKLLMWAPSFVRVSGFFAAFMRLRVNARPDPVLHVLQANDDPAVIGDEFIDISDPATGIPGVHNWGGEYLPIGITGFGANGINLAPWQSGEGYIFGVITASPGMPEPGTLLLLVIGMFGLIIAGQPKKWNPRKMGLPLELFAPQQQKMPV